MKKYTFTSIVLALCLVALVVMPVAAQDGVEIRMVWYSDGNEGEVMRDLLDRFEEANPDISVVLDPVAYADIHTILQAQVETGDAPDLARITDVGRFTGNYLDMTDMVESAEYWTSNFPTAVLDSLRAGDDDEGIYGFPTQFTVTGPYVNETLFEQAGVEIPGPEATWDEWVEAAVEVAETTQTPYAVAIDRSGHRFWGPSVTLGATYVNEDGSFTVDSPGFRDTAEMIVSWHERDITPLEVWAGGGGGYAAANEFFVNGQLVFYMSGSWQIGQFAERIGDTFDWAAVPNPSGPGGSTGIPGGAVLVAFEGTEHPEEVSMLMDYLASEEILGEFSEQTLFIPGHIGLAEAGLDYPSNAEPLNVFLSEIPKLAEEAYALQYHPQTFALNTAIRDRISQVIVGELTLDEAIVEIQETVDEAVAEAS